MGSAAIDEAESASAAFPGIASVAATEMTADSAIITSSRTWRRRTLAWTSWLTRGGNQAKDWRQ
jgi:hypothetical protein